MVSCVITWRACTGNSMYSICAIRLPLRDANQSRCMMKATAKNFRQPKYQKDWKLSVKPVDVLPGTGEYRYSSKAASASGSINESLRSWPTN